MAMDMGSMDPHRTGFLPNLKETNNENIIEEKNLDLPLLQPEE